MGRLALILLAGLAAFAAVAALLLQLMPAPLKSADYMVIGALGTLAGLVVIFLILLSTSMKGTRLFVRRARRPRSPRT